MSRIFSYSNVAQVQRSRVSTQFDSTSAVLANITGLTATIIANKAYRFEVDLFVTADATGGSKYAMAGTATATTIVYEVLLIDNTTNLNTITSKQTALAGAIGQAGTTNGYCRIAGLILCSTSGTLVPQFSQNVGVGTSSVIVGSNFTVQEIL